MSKEVLYIILAYAFLSFMYGYIYGGDRALQVGTAAGGGMLIVIFLVWLLYTHYTQRHGSKITTTHLIHITPDLRYFLQGVSEGTIDIPDNLTLTVKFLTVRVRHLSISPRFTVTCTKPGIVKYYFKTGTASDIIAAVHTIESAFFDEIFSISGPSTQFKINK